MRQRFAPSPAQRRVQAERSQLLESRPCLKHNVYYQTHQRMGGRIVKTPGCPKCHEERLAEWQAREAADAKRL